VYQSSHVCQDCTDSVPIVKKVKNSKKTVKTAKMTIGVPIVTGLPKTVKRQSKQQKWPLAYQSSHASQSPPNTQSRPNIKIYLYAELLMMQRVVDKVKEWCDQWLLSHNVNKCYHTSYSSRQSIDTSYYMQQKEYVCIFQKVDYIKDFGVIFDSQLTSSEHIHQKINKA